MDALRIAAVGDYFIGVETFRRALEGELSTPFTLTGTDLPWPDVPFHDRGGPAGPEIAEYTGRPEDIESYVADAEIFLTHLGPVTRGLLDKAPGLRFIGLTRGSHTNVDMPAARERGITVANVPGRNASAVAEFTVGAILSCVRRITTGHSGLAAGTWRGDLYRFDRTGDELSDLTVGILGYSHIGQRVARLLKPFGCRIIVCDPFVSLNVYDASDGVEQTDIDDMMARSDIVTLHARVTPDTIGIVSRERIAAMKPGAVLVNTARGSLVDQAALVEALKSGHLGGAALDTFVVEPPEQNDELLRLPNVTLTPHIAGASRRVATYATEVLVKDLRRFLEGKPLANRCK